MISAKDIHFCIKNQPILDQVNMEVLPEEVVAVLGPNGAGKSSLLKLLSGEQRCTHGKITINQVSVNVIKARQLAKYRAVMSQHSVVNFPYTVEEIIALGKLSHDKNSPSHKLMEEVMEITNTKSLRERMFDGLSGGEKQRVQLARVLLQIWEEKPFTRYLFLDEPTSSMDIAQQHQVLKLVGQLRNRNIGVFAILHDLNLAAQYADKVILMKKGKVMAFGPTENIMIAQKLSAVYDHPISVMSHPLDNGQLIITSEISSKTHTYTSLKLHKL